MTLSADMVDAMVSAGLTAEQMAAVVKAALAADEAVLAAKREKAAERKRKSRARHAPSRDITVTDCDGCDTPAPNDVGSLPTNIQPSLTPTPPIGPPAQKWPKDAFVRFYRLYPRRVKPHDAERALEKIRKAGKVAFEDIIAGVQRYLASEPDPQFIPYPATWLNGGQWGDELGTASKTKAPSAISVNDIPKPGERRNGKIWFPQDSAEYDQAVNRTPDRKRLRDRSGGWWFDTEPAMQAAE